MLTIIINADDAGISPIVNHAIFNLMKRGQLTSATILANGPAFEAAISGARLFPECSFGAHLNLTQFKPLTQNDALAPLMDDRGQFHGGPSARRICAPHALLDAVCDEWCAQVDRIRAAGLSVSHLDSHQHIHTCPAYFNALKRVQTRCGIGKVRMTRNFYRPRSALVNPVRRMLKALWNTALRRVRPATWTTDLFTSVRDYQATASSPKWAGHGVIELMTHPGNPGSDDEVAWLGTDWQACLPYEVRLASYRQGGV